MKLFSGLFGLVLILLALAFAISNRQAATISLWPFDAQVEAPLYLLTLGILLLGLLLGAGFAWLSMLPHQLAARRLRNDIGHLHDKLEELQQTISAAPRMRDDGTALPPPKSKWRFWGRGS
jgi:uncharacterized integral membrane protein